MNQSKNIDAQDVCNLLNELLKLDYDCVESLINFHSKCNLSIADLPNVMVREDDNGEFSLGIIGLLNGLFELDEKGFGKICYEFDDVTKKIINFRLTSLEKQK